MNYIDSLNSLFQKASGNPNKEIDSDKAQSLIQQISQTGKSTGFQTYSSAMAEAITGMTEVEAFIYLNEILSRLDAHDGASDDNIQVAESEEAFSQAMTAIGLGSDSDDIQSKLVLASDVFKQDDNPDDSLYIQALTNSQNGNVITAGDTKLMSQALLSSTTDNNAISGQGETDIPLNNALATETQPQQDTVVTAGNAATPKGGSNNVVGVYTTFTDVFSGGGTQGGEDSSVITGDDIDANKLGVDIIRDPNGTQGDGGDSNNNQSQDPQTQDEEEYSV